EFWILPSKCSSGERCTDRDQPASSAERHINVTQHSYDNSHPLLVDYIVGPFAVIGEAAHDFLDADTKVAFRSLTLRTAGVVAVKAEGNAATSASQQDAALLWSKRAEGAWIEISPPGLGSADVVLHIPNVITLPIQCKDRANVFPYHEVGKALNSMLVESKPWRDAEETQTNVNGNLNEVTAGSASVAPKPRVATLTPNVTQNSYPIDYGQKRRCLSFPSCTCHVHLLCRAHL
ncbi:Hypothetical protein, putative, partial [Bodo saltans]